MAVVMEPVVTEEKLRGLLAEQCEHPELDYKTTLNLGRGQAKDLLELAKDVAAMQSNVEGGYIVVGVDDRGAPLGLALDLVRAFDESTLRPKLEKYLTAPKIQCQVHEIDGKALALIYVAPNPYGWCVVHTDGEYSDPANGKMRQVFRHGDVLVRHGTSSELWNDADRDRIVAQVVARRKEQWRREFSAEFAAQADLTRTVDRLAGQPSTAVSWVLDADTFDELVTELFRRDDDVPLRKVLNNAVRDATRLFAAVEGEHKGQADLDRLLDRVTAYAALAIEYDRPRWVEHAVSALERLYELGFDNEGVDQKELRVVRLWFDIITRVYALGALAVRKQAWREVKLLADRRPDDQAFDYWGSWLRHAFTMAAHARIFETEEKAGLLARAHNTIREIAALHPDRDAAHGSILNSLCQFDVYGCLVVIGERGSVRSKNFYPNFSRYLTPRSAPAFDTMVTNTAVRTELFDGDDQLLAQALQELIYRAGREGIMYNGWDGLESRQVEEFLIRNLPPGFRPGIK